MSIYSNVEKERERKMKTSSSKREQIDSERLSSSFSRTIIWRCYRRGKTKKKSKRRRETTWTIWRRATDARATKTKHKRERGREKTTVTANHASMMYNNNRTPFFFFFSLCLALSLALSLSVSLSLWFTFAVVDHRSIRDKEIEQHTTIIISWVRRDNTMVGYMIKKTKTTVR